MLNNSVRGSKVRRTLKCLLAGALASAPLAAGPASAESLVEAIEAAITYHPRIYRDQALSVAADHAVEEAYSEFLPKLDLEASSGWEVTDSPTTRGTGRGVVELYRNEARLSLTQLVFDFHGTANRVASAESELESSNADVQATSEEIGIETVNVFLDVLGAREQTFLAEQNLSDLEGILGLIRGRAEAGRAAEADLDQGVSRVALARAELAVRRGAERQAVSRFIETVGHTPGALERPAEPDYPQSTDLDAALAVAMDSNPLAASTAALWDARKADIEVERSNYFPRLDLEASGSVGDNLDGVRGGSNDLLVQLRLRWNLFNGFGDLARTRAATQQANAASRQDAETRRVIREAVRISFQALRTAKQRLPDLRDDATASEQTFEAYRQQYDVGQRSLLDLVDARSEMFNAQTAEVRGTYEVLRSHYELLASMGVLLGSMGIIVFPDAEQYREHQFRYETVEATPAEDKVQNAAVSFSEADLSGEVMVPGAMEFGSWLGEDGQRSMTLQASIDEDPQPSAAPATVEAVAVEAAPIRRDIEGILVETVPPMGDLPESDVAVLPAVAIGELNAVNSDVESQDAGLGEGPAVSAGEANALAPGSDLGVGEQGWQEGLFRDLLFAPVLEELAALPEGKSGAAGEGRLTQD